MPAADFCHDLDKKQVCWEPNTGPAKRSRGSSSHMPRRSIPFSASPMRDASDSAGRSKRWS